MSKNNNITTLDEVLFFLAEALEWLLIRLDSDAGAAVWERTIVYYNVYTDKFSLRKEYTKSQCREPRIPIGYLD